ncbi:hypothetical protein [Phytohabitans aurantiacus]|uniref:DNA (cytosine-5-)-methyltransferase n=1 Tax=Phytohabitans aurantiacus TaxID=3016789 RepID=A0ABQ5R1P0_9ACTN|nr:hypothetical protein [Phytohabitans aurantiacus]GLI00646.1 hypothetical protein Pa4123_59220 [Phytohabitans aurantiacus]
MQRGLPDLVEPGGSRHALLPTPTAASAGSNRSPSPGAARRPSLPQLVREQLTPGTLLPTPTVADSRSSANATAGRTAPLSGHAGRTLTDAARLLPTPRASDGAKGCPGQRGSHGDLTLPSAAVQVAKVLPTPTVSDGRGPGVRTGGGSNLRTTVTALLPDPASTAGPVPDAARWGIYADAVARWEALLGRPVPDPTQPGTHGKPVLAPPFVEWLMGLPAGWVTDPALGLPRTLALKVLGNGVVPQQAAVALRLLLCPHRWAVPDDQ